MHFWIGCVAVRFACNYRKSSPFRSFACLPSCTNHPTPAATSTANGRTDATKMTLLSDGGGGGWEWELRTRADSVEQFLDARQCQQQKWVATEEDEGPKTDLENNIAFNGEEGGPLISLPSLREAVSDPILQRKLFLQKLRQCQKLFDFGDPMEQNAEKEVKSAALKEVNEFIAIGRDCAMLTEPEIGAELFRTVECNLFRVLPPSAYSALRRESDAEDFLLGPSVSNVFLEPTWPHLQPVYRLLRQLVGRLTPQQLDPFLSDRFCTQMLELLRSADSREREQAKQMVHDIYSKIMERRATIRKQMAHIMLSHTYECMPFNGMDELLQVLGDIINGFNVPLKEEHRQFLLRVLLPLHKSPALPLFFSKLAYCVMLYVEKDAALAKPVVKSLLRNWPLSCGVREVLFITEVEEILSRIGAEELRTVMAPLFHRLVQCTTSQNARVAERALLLLKKPQVMEFFKSNCQIAFPAVLPALFKSQRHWCTAVTSLALETINVLMEMDRKFFVELVMNIEKEQQIEQ
uniref:Serine/threonine protein phosphatase 2A regulatory subunit n=1 Tax=Globodera rostochiensis TaxID=31243 RepID=A0A914HT07_GLORO